MLQLLGQFSKFLQIFFSLWGFIMWISHLLLIPLFSDLKWLRYGPPYAKCQRTLIIQNSFHSAEVIFFSGPNFLQSFKLLTHPSDQDPSWEGSPRPKIEKNRCVLKWFLGKIQCFKTMFFWGGFLVENQALTPSFPYLLNCLLD